MSYLTDKISPSIFVKMERRKFAKKYIKHSKKSKTLHKHKSYKNHKEQASAYINRLFNNDTQKSYNNNNTQKSYNNNNEKAYNKNTQKLPNNNIKKLSKITPKNNIMKTSEILPKNNITKTSKILPKMVKRTTQILLFFLYLICLINLINWEPILTCKHHQKTLKIMIQMQYNYFITALKINLIRSFPKYFGYLKHVLKKIQIRCILANYVGVYKYTKYYHKLISIIILIMKRFANSYLVLIGCKLQDISKLYFLIAHSNNTRVLIINKRLQGYYIMFTKLQWCTQKITHNTSIVIKKQFI